MVGARFREAPLVAPREKAKNDQGHDVHLSAQAVAIIKALPRIGVKDGLIFTTNGRTAVSGFSRAKERLDVLMASEAGTTPPWILHDLRRTATTGMARLKFAPHVSIACSTIRSERSAASPDL